jgi:6-phospho-beta-glucosidase
VRLAILGGGGFRVPLVYQALMADRGEGRITEIVLYDTDAARLTAIGLVLRRLADGAIVKPPAVTETRDLDTALRGTDFVFSAIRVGGLEGRATDERIAIEHGVLGQETVGAGGIAYGLRTLPVATNIARRIAALAPSSWVINFTNPAGMVTEAMLPYLGDRVIGICDSPSGLCRRVALALGLDRGRTTYDYAGLNHLGWLRGIRTDGVDHLPDLLADDEALTSFEEGRLFGAEWLRTLGSIPNEYLHYYYFARETREAVAAAAPTRGTYLLEQQSAFYAATAQRPEAALELWERARAERESTYGAESREVAGAGERDERDMTAGGYEQVALSLMRAIAHDEPADLILNVRNRGTLRHLDDDAVIEVPCVVGANGPRPIKVGQLTEHQAGLVCEIKAVERSAIEAAATGSRAAAIRALAWHPLVDSVTTARRLLDAYAAALPDLAAFG